MNYKRLSFFYIIIICFFLFKYQAMSLARYLELISTDPKAMSLASSVTANPPDLMSIHYNPAGLADLREGYVISQGLTLSYFKKSINFSPDNNFQVLNAFKANDDPLANSSVNSYNSQMYFPIIGSYDMPLNITPFPFCISYRPKNSDFVFANAIYLPFAKAYNFGDKNSKEFSQESFFEQHLIYASPSFGYFINNNFSVGISLGLGQSSLGYEGDIRIVDETIALTRILPLDHAGILPFEKIADINFELRDDFSPSFNFGIIWEPYYWISFGAMYRSPIRSDLKGNLSVNYAENFFSFCKWLKDNPGSAETLDILDMSSITDKIENHKASINNYQFPQSFDMGVNIRLSNRLRFMADIHWINWSKIEEYNMKLNDSNAQILRLMEIFTNNGELLKYKKDYNDIANFSFGVEYQLKESISFRFGYEKKKANTNINYFDLFSDPDINYFGAGLGLKLKNRIKLDIALAYFYSNEVLIPNGKGSNLNSQIDSKILNPYIGQNLKSKISGFQTSFKITLPYHSLNKMLMLK